MQWWNDFVDWTSSDSGGRLISDVLVPFIAIVVAGVVAALIGRGATKRVVALQEREAKNAAVAGIVSASRKAATWGALTHDERRYADHLAEDADIRLRLLPVAGAPMAADWARHEIADIKKNSSTFSFQADQSLAEFRDRILEWQSRPARARKTFKYDLERWKFDSPDPDAELITRQQEWNADQAERREQTPSTTSLRPGGASATPARDGRPAPAGQSVAAGPSAPGTRPGGSADSAAPLRPALPTPAAVDTPAAAPAATVGAGAPAAPTSPRPTPADDDRLTRPYGSPAPWSASTGSAGSASARDDAADAARSADSAATDRYDDATRGNGATTAVLLDDQSGQAPGARNTTVQLSGSRGGDVTGRSGGSDVPAGSGRPFDQSRTTATRPADARESDEATHTQPISASELRRNSEDDD